MGDSDLELRPSSPENGNPLESLSATARRIVETSLRLIRERGYSAMSLESISKECSINKAAVRYHFGNKAGLMEVVVEAFTYENSAFIVEEGAGPLSLHEFLTAKRERVVENLPLAMAFLELLPNVIRHDSYRERFTSTYEWLSDAYRHVLEDAGLVTPGSREGRTLALLLIATIDGLTIQHALDPGRFDADEACELLEAVLSGWSAVKKG